MGGAIVSIYINDPAAEDIRPTKDIDISISVHSLSALELFREKLAQRGVVQSADLDVICRFKHKDILVDVMNTEEIGWAPANRWFAPGFEMKEAIYGNLFYDMRKERYNRIIGICTTVLNKWQTK